MALEVIHDLTVELRLLRKAVEINTAATRRPLELEKAGFLEAYFKGVIAFVPLA